ncbi:hypothetical protein TCAL_14709 [Tigriopus californicus]|uniref:IMS import disulfide relay-system CHCH-CHCH-like Cx9C domain-containing protein n=1 Tax=Tigriopus californicus TaxID=6832 RepID=A0A553PGX3_TIGCA|nr:hypothetical protein TCAL_14709 [Tigriopus californicus]
MDSVRKAKARLGSYSKWIASCGPEGAAYAKCVAQDLAEVQKGQCQAEFDAFKKCVQTAAKKAGSKL